MAAFGITPGIDQSILKWFSQYEAKYPVKVFEDPPTMLPKSPDRSRAANFADHFALDVGDANSAD